MPKAIERVRNKLSLNEKYKVEESVFEIPRSDFPNGIKASYVLVDTSIKKPRLLVDNTDHPHEFHMHTELPEDKSVKVFLGTYDHMLARELFYAEVKRILNEQ